MSLLRPAAAGPVVIALLVLALSLGTPRANAATCTSSVGPGIPPPASVPSGVDGFHASWYGQSGYPTLCPGERSTSVVAYYNSGTRGWVSGRLGEMAFLGTWGPLPGQDQPSTLGGDGTNGSPATGWPRYNRVAAQPADYVGPNQVAWFQFTIQAPQQPGTYRLYIRPLVEGASWMEDFGVFWQVTVQAPTGPPSPTPTPAPLAGTIDITPKDRATLAVGAERTYTINVSGVGGCINLAFVDGHTPRADGSLRDLEKDANGFAVGDERADLSTDAIFTSINGLATSSSVIECVGGSSPSSVTFTITSFTINAFVRPIAYRDSNNNHKLDVDPLDRPAETFGAGGPVRFLPPNAPNGTQSTSVGTAAVDEQLFADAGQVFRWKDGDSFSLNGTPITRVQFEKLVVPGAQITVSYRNDALPSSFDVTSIAGYTAPQVAANTGSYDGTGLINDVRLTLTESASNADGVSYSISRASSSSFVSCNAGSGTYAQIATVTVPLFQHVVTYDDRNVDPGTYCYGVTAIPPAGGPLPTAYSTLITLPTPVPMVASPSALELQLVAIGGVATKYDAGDVFKIAFNEPLGVPSDGAYIRARDIDGSIADFVCGTNATCTINDATETLAGLSYAPGSVLTVSLTGEPRVNGDGSVPGLQVAATVLFSTGIRDTRGAEWSLGSSTKLLINYPPQR